MDLERSMEGVMGDLMRGGGGGPVAREGLQAVSGQLSSQEGRRPGGGGA